MELRNQFNQDSSSAKRALSSTTGEDQKRREDSIHEDTIFNPSPDDLIPIQRADPDPDPTRFITRTDPINQYRECQRNHAAHLGTHVVDGCGDFLPDAAAAMICAACGCHRNFHRKETAAAAVAGASNYQVSFTPRHPIVYHPLPFRQAPANHHRGISEKAAAPAMMAFGDASSDDLNVFRSEGEGGSGRKRFRTKFTAEQKEKMMELAEKMGWRIQKKDEDDVQRFCAATGVKRQVFKVWMHNNKQAMKRKQLDPVDNGFGSDTDRTV